MLLVELHHLFIELLAVVLVLLLQATHLGLQGLHLEHSLGALEGEGGDQQHDHERHKGDRDCIVMRKAVKLVYEPGGCIKHWGYRPFKLGVS